MDTLTGLPTVRARRAMASSAFHAKRAALVEDLTYMAEHGEGLSGAARRCGKSFDALRQYLHRNGHSDLLATLQRQEPKL